MAQWLKCLPCDREDGISELQIPHKCQVGHDSLPVVLALEEEDGIPGASPRGLGLRDSASKNKVEQLRKIASINLGPPYACADIHVNLHICVHICEPVYLPPHKYS